MTKIYYQTNQKSRSQRKRLQPTSHWAQHADDFNYFYTNYINEHISTDNLLTDRNNQWQVQQAENDIYLDSDWCSSSQPIDCLKYEQLCSSWCAQYADKWISLLEQKNISIIQTFNSYLQRLKVIKEFVSIRFLR